MATPSINDFVLKTNKPLTAQDWETNLQIVINYLTDGTADLVANTLTLTGALTVGTDITAPNIHATTLYGDGSNVTGLNTQNKNWVLNGNGAWVLSSAHTLVKDIYSNSVTQGVPYWSGMATGTAVTAGTFSTTTSANIGRTGTSIKFAGMILTGAGKMYLRYRMASVDAKNFIGQIASFGSLVYHDTGAAINYTITIRKANSADDFSAVTVIQAGTPTAVNNITSTQIKLEAVSMGACGNGIEIEILVDSGAITTKNFEFTNLQLEISATSTAYDFRLYKNEPEVWEQIYGYTATSAITSVNITGLKGDTDLYYKAYIFAKNAAAGTCNVVVTFNSDGGSTYCSNKYYLAGATVGNASSTGASNAQLFFMNTSLSCGFADVMFYAKSGSARGFVGNGFDWSATTLGSGNPQIISGSWHNTTDELTSIQIVGDGVAKLATGSRIELWSKRH